MVTQLLAIPNSLFQKCFGLQHHRLLSLFFPALGRNLTWSIPLCCINILLYKSINKILTDLYNNILIQYNGIDHIKLIDGLV